MEVKLFCVVVGEEGNAFPVDIAACETVGDLKDMIKKKQEYTFAASRLELFLATLGGAWLTKTEAAAAKLDEDGHVVTEDAKGTRQLFASMDETWAISDYFGPNFQRERGRIHVLVVVPTEDKATSPLAAIAVTLFKGTFMNVPSTTPSKTLHLQKKLVKKYKCACGKNQNGDSMLLCMVLDIGLPSSLVIASHIFRREHDRVKGAFVQIENIDDVRNGLLLFKPIESAFDDLDIAFLVDTQDQFILKIFNPSIKETLLVENLTQEQWDALGGDSVPANWETSERPIYAPNAPQFDLLTTFGDLDGKALRFPSGSTLRPFRRCLYHQALLARANAIVHAWDSQDCFLEDFSSEGFTLDDKMRLLYTSL